IGGGRGIEVRDEEIRTSRLGARGLADLRAVEKAVVVRVGIQRIGSEAELLAVGEPVAVRILREGIGAEQDLLAVGDAVAVGIRVSRISLTWIDPPVAVLVLLAVGEAVAVGVGLERIGGVVTARRSGEESARARRFGALR